MSAYREPEAGADEVGADEVAAGHASYALRIKPIVIALVLLALLCWSVALGMRPLFRSFLTRGMEDAPAVHPLRKGPELPPEPRLQAYPVVEMAEHRAAIDAHAESYGWIDEQLEVVHLPLDRAFVLVSERGLPDWPELAEVPVDPAEVPVDREGK